jgi:hypothetical protein
MEAVMAKMKINKEHEREEKGLIKSGNKQFIRHEEAEVKAAKKHEPKKDGAMKSHKGKDGKPHKGPKAGCKACK